MTFLVRDLASAVELLLAVLDHARSTTEDFSVNPNIPSDIVKYGMTVDSASEGLIKRLSEISGVVAY